MSKTADLNLDMIDYAVKLLKKKMAKDKIADMILVRFKKYFADVDKKEAKKEAKEVIKAAVEDMKESYTSKPFLEYFKEMEEIERLETEETESTDKDNSYYVVVRLDKDIFDNEVQAVDYVKNIFSSYKGYDKLVSSAYDIYLD